MAKMENTSNPLYKMRGDSNYVFYRIHPTAQYFEFPNHYFIKFEYNLFLYLKIPKKRIEENHQAFMLRS